MYSATTPVIVAAARTPIGRAHPDKGCYRQVRAEDLLVPVLQALLARTSIDPTLVEDCIVGCSQQTGEQGGNLARLVALLAGLPITTAGTTVNRWCGSSLEALHIAAHAIRAGDKDVQFVAGVEHMTHLPMETGFNPHPALYARVGQAAFHMGLTAEFLANKFQISRTEQDDWALRSHQRAVATYEQGAFADEIIPILGHDEAGHSQLITRDQCVRSDTSAAALANLRPAFMPDVGSVTAGNSSPKNDGAAALLVMSTATAQRLGLPILAAIQATAVIGVEPALMGLAPAAVVPKLLRRANLTLDQIDRIEINEAFAVQVLACLRELSADPQRVNVRGGAIALGHPLGASGARIMTTLVNQLVSEDLRYGIATMCIGMGQGIATLIERV
jgi:acetyl-CoA acyltransferase